MRPFPITLPCLINLAQNKKYLPIKVSQCEKVPEHKNVFRKHFALAQNHSAQKKPRRNTIPGCNIPKRKAAKSKGAGNQTVPAAQNNRHRTKGGSYIIGFAQPQQCFISVLLLRIKSTWHFIKIDHDIFGLTVMLQHNLVGFAPNA